MNWSCAFFLIAQVSIMQLEEISSGWQLHISTTVMAIPSELYINAFKNYFAPAIVDGHAHRVWRTWKINGPIINYPIAATTK